VLHTLLNSKPAWDPCLSSIEVSNQRTKQSDRDSSFQGGSIPQPDPVAAIEYAVQSRGLTRRNLDWVGLSRRIRAVRETHNLCTLGPCRQRLE